MIDSDLIYIRTGGQHRLTSWSGCHKFEVEGD